MLLRSGFSTGLVGVINLLYLMMLLMVILGLVLFEEIHICFICCVDLVSSS